MKEIISVGLEEIFLYPSKTFFTGTGALSHYLGAVNGRNGNVCSTVHIFLFDCLSSEEIPGIIDQEIEILKDYLEKNPPSKEKIDPQIDCFSKIKEGVSSPAHLKEPPEGLIRHLEREAPFFPKTKNFLFISGVSFLETR